MPLTLTVHDESITGERTGGIVLEFLTECITVRELIRSRVYQEVQDYNLQKITGGRMLVQPSSTEAALNSPRAAAKSTVNWKPQFEKAVEAFERKQILVLIGSRQAASLDEEIVLTPSTTIAFLRLVPLVGG